LKAVFTNRLKLRREPSGSNRSRYREAVKGFMPQHVTSTPPENASVSINAKLKMKNAKATFN
jgi:hypothetical protein